MELHSDRYPHALSLSSGGVTVLRDAARRGSIRGLMGKLKELWPLLVTYNDAHSLALQFISEFNKRSDEIVALMFQALAVKPHAELTSVTLPYQKQVDVEDHVTVTTEQLTTLKWMDTKQRREVLVNLVQHWFKVSEMNADRILQAIYHSNEYKALS